jgi:excinuclease UvrABC nuclease subunit
MTCGIYKLTFSSGLFYIGKSLNIEKRWQQHFDSMQKNKSAAAVQAQYNMLGLHGIG